MELFNAILPSLVEIATILLTALAGYLGILVKKWLQEKTELAKQELKKEQWAIIEKLISHTVSYIEQTFEALEGEKKFEEAKKTIIRLATEQGIELTELQLKVVTESFVNEFYGHVDDVLPIRLEGTK
jgi:Asp-tRNA(Asn)/Glu-tRNA(Gln) amidotransferase A subunit family amidase